MNRLFLIAEIGASNFECAYIILPIIFVIISVFVVRSVFMINFHKRLKKRIESEIKRYNEDFAFDPSSYELFTSKDLPLLSIDSGYRYVHFIVKKTESYIENMKNLENAKSLLQKALKNGDFTTADYVKVNIKGLTTLIENHRKYYLDLAMDKDPNIAKMYGYIEQELRD